MTVEHWRLVQVQGTRRTPGAAGTWLHRPARAQLWLCSGQEPPSEEKVPSFFLTAFSVGMIFLFALQTPFQKDASRGFLVFVEAIQ